MPPKKGIGVITSYTVALIDHIVPLCQIMDVPLLCTNPWIHQLVQLHYPEMPLILDEGEDYTLDHVLKDYEVLFYVDHARKHNGAFQFVEHSFQGPARSVCSLHGNSDKKRNLYWMEKFIDEDVTVIYGKHMLDFLEEKGVLERLKHCVVSGNYRREYYLERKEFFDAQAKHLFFPDSGKKTIFYAPTWTHPSKNWAWRVDYSCFFEAHKYVLDNIPSDFQVIVKLHPFLVHNFPYQVEEIKEKYAERENVSFITDFPLIYPLLQKVDCYLGDYSSIGYDFLSVNRPLFFLNPGERNPERDKGVYLYQCGRAIGKEEMPKLYQIISKEMEKDRHHEMRKKTYHYAFGERKPLKLLKKEIEEAYA